MVRVTNATLAINASSRIALLLSLATVPLSAANRFATQPSMLSSIVLGRRSAISLIHLSVNSESRVNMWHASGVAAFVEKKRYSL